MQAHRAWLVKANQQLPGFRWDLAGWACIEQAESLAFGCQVEGAQVWVIPLQLRLGPTCFGLGAAGRQGRHRMEGEKASAGELLLLEVDPVEQGQTQPRIQPGSLPGGEHIDGTWREAQHQAPAAIGRLGVPGGQGPIQATRRQAQLGFQQRQHGAQVGGLRQAIAPAALEGLDHRRADAGGEGQLAQIQALGLTGLAQPFSGGLQPIELLCRGERGAIGRLGTPPATQELSQADGGSAQNGSARGRHSELGRAIHGDPGVASAPRGGRRARWDRWPPAGDPAR